MGEGVDLTVAQRHYKGLIKAGKHRDAGAPMTICTGACWSPARLAEEGMIKPEKAKCPLCGVQDADERRLFWECPKIMEATRPQYKSPIDIVQNIAE